MNIKKIAFTFLVFTLSAEPNSIARAGEQPAGYTMYFQSTQSENLIYVRGDDYLVPCMSRNPSDCPASGYDYGGKVRPIGHGVVKLANFNEYFCATWLAPQNVNGKCTSKGFARY